jgi:hypothetical protein
VQGHSPEFDAAVRNSHVAVSKADLISDGKTIRQLEVHAGAVTADRTAAQMRSFGIDIIDRDGTLLPTGMGSDLAPFGSRIQLYRGVRLENVETVSLVRGPGASWTPTATGVMNGVSVDVDGGLILGP